MSGDKYRRDVKVGFLAGLYAGLSVQNSAVLGALLKEDEEEEEFYKKKRKGEKR